MIVLDANILIRAVLGRRVRHLLDTYAARGVHFYAPDVAFVDAQKYLPPLLVKKEKPVADVSAAIEYLQHIVEPVDQEFYVLFEADARQRLRNLKRKNLAPRARFALATLRLTVAAFIFGTECDDLLSC